MTQGINSTSSVTVLTELNRLTDFKVTRLLSQVVHWGLEVLTGVHYLRIFVWFCCSETHMCKKNKHKCIWGEHRMINCRSIP